MVEAVAVSLDLGVGGARGLARSRAPLAIALAVLAGCTAEVSGSGTYGQVAYADLPALHGVRLDGEIEDVEVRVDVAMSGPQSVILSGDDNIVRDFVKLSVTEDGILEAHLQGGVHSVEPTIPIRIDATVASFDTVDVTASSAVRVTGAGVTSFDVVADGGSTVTLAGAGGDALHAVLTDGSALDAQSYPASGVELRVVSSDALVRLASPGTASGSASGTSGIQVLGSESGCSGIQLTAPATCSASP